MSFWDKFIYHFGTSLVHIHFCGSVLGLDNERLAGLVAIDDDQLMDCADIVYALREAEKAEDFERVVSDVRAKSEEWHRKNEQHSQCMTEESPVNTELAHVFAVR